jgi:sec-independent protein translocase protein TatC
MSNGFVEDPDDYFKDTRMSFGDHIEELRTHLWRAVYGFLIALVLSLFLGKYVLEGITAPVKAQLDGYYDRRMAKVLTEKKEQIGPLNQPTPFRKVWFLRDQLRDVAKGVEPDQRRPVVQTAEEKEREESPPPLWKKWLGLVPDTEKPPLMEDFQGETRKILDTEKDKDVVPVWMSVDNPLFASADTTRQLREILQIDSPTTLRAEESFFVWFKVCVVTGLVLGSPWIFWQIWAFVAAGLYPSEKRLVHVYLPISLGLFLAGVVICELFVIPKALEALLWFNEWLGFKPDIRLNDWLGFAIFMPVIFGLSFQTPLIMLFLNRLGIMDADTFRNKRRYAWMAMAVFAAVCTPSTDAFSMLFLWVPMSLLFELGILLIRLTPAPPAEDEESPEADELVEV